MYVYIYIYIYEQLGSQGSGAARGARWQTCNLSLARAQICAHGRSSQFKFAKVQIEGLESQNHRLIMFISKCPLKVQISQGLGPDRALAETNLNCRKLHNIH